MARGPERLRGGTVLCLCGGASHRSGGPCLGRRPLPVVVPPASVVGDMGTRRLGLAGTMDMGTGAPGPSTPVSTPSGRRAAGSIETDAGSGAGVIG